jgi:hypothetical protein
LADINSRPRTTLYTDYGAPIHIPEKKPSRHNSILQLNELVTSCIQDIRNYVIESIPVLALDVLRRQKFRPPEIPARALSLEMFKPVALTEYYIYKNYLEGRYKTKWSYSQIET